MPERAPNFDQQSIREPKINTSLSVEIHSYINVDQFAQHFGVENPITLEALQKFPTLAYLLGTVTEQPQTRDTRPDGIERDIFFLTEGSGMFGLKKIDDAMRWKGIFNHIMGTVRNVTFLTNALSNISENQLQELAGLGFDADSFRGLDTQVLRDFFLISHAGRRQMDEKSWHNLSGNVHPEGDSGKLSKDLLIKYGAHPFLVDLMRVEDHSLLTDAGKTGYFPNALDNILTYCDWTYGQKPTPLIERFEALRKSGRQEPQVLDILENSGMTFENALKEVLGGDIYEQMVGTKPDAEELQIREAFCAASGISPQRTFPEAFALPSR